MRSMLFWLSAPVGWLSWTAGLARATIEKISGRASSASSDFFICLTSRKISYDMARAPEILRTFLTLERAARMLFLAPGIGACQLILIRTIGNKTLVNRILREASAPNTLRLFWVCGGALGSPRSIGKGRG